MVWLDLIAAELAEHDPANADTYAMNAEAAMARVRALDARISARLAPVTARPFVVFHDAYGYFAGHYGLAVAGSVALGDAAAPGAGRLRALQERLIAEGVICAFPEAQHDPKLVETLVEGSPVKIGAVLDPSGSTLTAGPGLYDALLEGLAEGLATCLAE
jgi:zinc transport system substrate-binding protein